MANGKYDFPFTILDIASVLNLTVRRRMTNRIYVDCPLPGCNPKKKGKMKLDTEKDSFHCYYCDETGGMLKLYSRTHSDISNSDAYREICSALNTGHRNPAVTQSADYKRKEIPPSIPQSQMVDIPVVHATFSAMLNLLTLSELHRKNLRDRGLTDEQIDKLGYKSTPKAWQCKGLTTKIIQQGCTVQGVPGFYVDNSGQWTVNFSSWTAGIIIPVRGIDAMIRGAQIRLDKPIKEKDADPEDKGAKYIWLSSNSKRMGVTSGTPVHFVGDPFAKTVYVTEGFLKADIAHCLMNRTFLATAGGNNVFGLDPLFALLAENGTKLIVVAEDMDKYRNIHIVNGESKIFALAAKHKLECKPLTWNPNHKGIDDWQLALRKKKEKSKEVNKLTFKEKFLYALCPFYDIEDYIDKWQNSQEKNQTLCEYLGLTEPEYKANLQGENLEAILLAQRKQWQFRIYQLDFGDKIEPKAFAFEGIKALHKAGYEQPPASEYRLIYDGTMCCPASLSENSALERIFKLFNDDFPKDYHGRSISPSDVIELSDNEQRRYYYRDSEGFVSVKFSPALALPMINSTNC